MPGGSERCGIQFGQLTAKRERERERERESLVPSEWGRAHASGVAVEAAAGAGAKIIADDQMIRRDRHELRFVLIKFRLISRLELQDWLQQAEPASRSEPNWTPPNASCPCSQLVP